MKKIGFLVNPIAGMGGKVGLKGTDGMVKEAIERGAHPVAPHRAKIALEKLNGEKKDLTFLSPSGIMGENVLRECGIPHSTVYHPKGVTSSYDTQKACKIFLEEDVDLIVFCGGDGTARDIYQTIGDAVPLVGVPAGVKMFSGVFSVTPHTLSPLLTQFIDEKGHLREASILDINEEKYRQNIFDTQLFGYAQTIYVPGLVQQRKSTFHNETEKESKRNIALFMRELMKDSALYILGAGTTTKSITDCMGIEKTLLGVDLVKNEKIIKKDVCEKDILPPIEEEDEVRIVVSPIGAQGFIFGRGTQQISVDAIRKVGVGNVIVVATPYKLYQTPSLLVDTGDEGLNKEFRGKKLVVCGYRQAQRKKIL